MTYFSKYFGDLWNGSEYKYLKRKSNNQEFHNKIQWMNGNAPTQNTNACPRATLWKYPNGYQAANIINQIERKYILEYPICFISILWHIYKVQKRYTFTQGKTLGKQTLNIVKYLQVSLH